MQTQITDRIESGRKAITELRDQAREDLTSRKATLEERARKLADEGAEKVQTLRKQAEELVHDKVEAVKEAQAKVVTTAEERLDEGKGRFAMLEVAALEQARAVLSRARETTGAKLPFLGKGEAALGDALVAIRASHPTTLPVGGFAGLSVSKVLPLLAGLADEDLKVLRAYETANKGRVTLLRAIDKQLAD